MLHITSQFHYSTTLVAAIQFHSKEKSNLNMHPLLHSLRNVETFLSIYAVLEEDAIPPWLDRITYQ